MTSLFHKLTISRFSSSILCGLLAVNIYSIDNGPKSSFDSADHKNLQFDLYLDLIRYNSQEKIGILPYILQKPNGVYFYYSADELIAKVLEITLTEIRNDKGNKELYVLCPLSEKHNKFIDRLCYTEVLNDSLEVHDSLGYAIDVKDGKRIIHFGKMPLSEAMTIYKNIIDENPIEYQCLQGMVDHIKEKYS